jgi:DNA replication protein
MEQLIFSIIRDEGHSFPALLLRHYKELSLTDEEMMLFFQIAAFMKEGKEFPTIYELRERMSADETRLLTMLQKLVQNQFLTIEDVMDKQTGIRSEKFCLDPLYWKLAHLLVSQKHAPSFTEKDNEQNLYIIFEQEFGRPLSPIECETLSIWQDNDKYADELIIAALREAVLAGKLSFKYIDRILFEWQRNNIHTSKQARDFSLKFRKAKQAEQQPKMVESFPFYNWLENEPN